jgi:hypothetical protein
MKYKVAWSKLKLEFNDSKGEVKFEEPGMLRSKEQVAALSAITRVVFGIGAMSTNGVGVEVRGAGVWWVPCAFKGSQKDGMQFVHALGKAAGLRELTGSERESWQIAYAK